MEKVVNILLVEDDALDVMDITRSLDKLQILYHLDVATNGEQALQLLSNPETPTPDLALIDINMPRMNGFELLTSMREQQQWRDIKSFIITTSEEQVDRKTAAELGVSGYIVKPLKLNKASSIDALNLMIDLINMKK